MKACGQESGAEMPPCWEPSGKAPENGRAERSASGTIPGRIVEPADCCVLSANWGAVGPRFCSA